MIMKALLNPKPANMAKILQTEEWFRKGFQPNTVFSILMVNIAKKDLLASLEFKLWTKYVSSFNHYNPNENVKMLNILGTNYDDQDWMLSRAMKVERTKDIATKLCGEL
ncbi:unnamed protein product [Phytophthora lilii]|uniref:Unnamed protein product n=1 Tax=Phytophthora lilii TaxID=2077276 RepID=A0A9W6UA79_9STRA|nr:unnamed protein product [Phytophthora lilii]